MKNRKIVFLGLALMIGIIFGLFFYLNQPSTQDPKRKELLMDQKSTEIPKWQASDTPLIPDADWKKLSKKNFSDDLLHMSAVIPGLRGAWAYNEKTKKAEFGNNWTPQGLDVSDKYYFVSAYDSKHKLNSLIYLISQKTKKYIKTIILPCQSHVGGLAYDYKNDLLFVSADYNSKVGGQTGRIATLKMSTIENYDAKKSNKPIKFDAEDTISWLANTSSVSYYQDMLWIPLFDKGLEGHSIIVGIQLTIDGKISKETHLSDFTIEELIKKGNSGEILFAVGYKEMQGVTLSGDYLVSSSSYGNKASRLMISDTEMKKGTVKLGEELTVDSHFTFSKIADFPLPPYLEEVALNDDSSKLYTVFESGAKKYRYRASEVIDRILEINVEFSSQK